MKTFDQSASVEALAAYRLAMLNRLLRYAMENSPFYQRRLSGLALPLASPEDIRSCPFTSIEDIYSSGAEMACVKAGQIERIVSIDTTGSSGAPKRLFFTKGDLERTVAFFHIGMQYMCGAGDKVAIMMPSASAYSIGRLLADGLARFGAVPGYAGLGSMGLGDESKGDKRAAMHAGDKLALAAIETLRKDKPHTIVGLPAHVRKLALLAPDIRPANVLLSADYISRSACETISRLWDCEVFAHYGSTETGYGGAVECQAHQGQHIRHDELWIEIIEPDSQEPVPHGQWGEIVVTTLRREAMPLIRYRTGDMGCLIYEPCACGSTLPRLGTVRGRIAELAQKVNIYELDELLFSCDRILDYRATHAEGTLAITLETSGSGSGAKEACANLLRARWPELNLEIVEGDAAAFGAMTARGLQPSRNEPGRNEPGKNEPGRNAKRRIERGTVPDGGC